MHFRQCGESPTRTVRAETKLFFRLRIEANSREADFSPEPLSSASSAPWFSSKQEDVRGFTDPFHGVKLLDLLRSKVFNVEGVAGDEVFQPFDRLHGANQAPGAPRYAVSLFSNRPGTALGAGFRKLVGHAVGGPRRQCRRP